MKIQTVTIESIANVKGGKRLPKGHEFLTTPTKHPYIRARDIGGGKVEIQEPVYITDSTYQKISRYTIKNNDIIITIVGVNIGDVGIVTEALEGANLTENASKISTNSDVCDPKFLLCQLSTPYNKFKFQQIAAGAAQGKLGLFKIKGFKVTLPKIDIQKNIVDIYFTYTSLIENNHRRVYLLEESARLLFREWFVYFKFPNHEKVKIVDRDGRKIPAEWDYLPFTKIKLFKKAPLGVPVFTDIRQYCQTSEIDGTSITGTGEEVDYENRPSRADIAPRINTVYFAKMKDTDKVLYFNKGSSDLLEKLLLSTGMVGFTTDEKYLGFLFGLLTSYEFIQYKNNFATGATQVSLNDASLKKIKVLFTALNLVELYSEIVNPLLEECSLLRNQNQKLAQAKDLLLPKLMKGELSVT